MIGEGQDLLALVGSLYDAATDPSLWEIALRRIAQSFGALGLFLCVLDMTSREVLLHLAYNPPPDDPPDGLWDGALPSLADTPSEHAVWRCPTAVRHTFQAWLEEGVPVRCRLLMHLWLPPPAAARADRLPATDPAEAEVLERWRALAPYVAFCA